MRALELSALVCLCARGSCERGMGFTILVCSVLVFSCLGWE